MDDIERRRVVRIGSTIAKARTAQNITREDFAARISAALDEVIPVEMISAWEFGRALPRATILPLIELLLSIPAGTIAHILWPDMAPPATEAKPAVLERIDVAVSQLDPKDQRLVATLAEALCGEAFVPGEKKPRPTKEPSGGEPRARRPRHPLRSGKRDHWLDVAAFREHREAAGKSHSDIADELDLDEKFVTDLEVGRTVEVQGILLRSLSRCVGVPEEWIEVEPDYPSLDAMKGWPVNAPMLTWVVTHASGDNGEHVRDDDDRRRMRVPWPRADLLAAAGIPEREWEVVELGLANPTPETALRLGRLLRIHAGSFMLDPAKWSVTNAR